MEPVGGCWTLEDRDRVLAEVERELWRYVGRHAQDTAVASKLVADVTGLTPRALETLRHLHLLLSDEVALFVDEALPELLGRRHATTVRRLEVGHGPVRGPVAWGATAAARARAGGADSGLYASTAAHKQLETPEMRILIHLMSALDCSADLIRDRSGDLSGAGWGARVGAVAEAVAVARQTPTLQALARDARVTAVRGGGVGRVAGDDVATVVTRAMLNACVRSSRTAVRALAAAYMRYRDLVAAPTSAALLRALGERVLAPLADDALYELWAVLGAAAALDEAGWSLRTAGLVGQEAAPFTYVAGDGGATARLYVGRTPPGWRGRSRYRAIFERYGLAGSTRRPDLIVELRRGRERRHLLVEVKRTRDGGYIADSVYKALGYLADFAEVFEGQQGTRGLLLLWDKPTAPAPVSDADGRFRAGAGAGSEAQGSDALALATCHTYRQTLQAAIEELAGPYAW